MTHIVDINDSDGNNVISIEVVRAGARLREIRKTCAHARVTIDEARSEVECRDCGAMLSPVWVMAQWADKWGEFIRLAEKYDESRAAYEAKTRTKCRHCGQMTPIVRPPKVVNATAKKGAKP